MHEKRRGQKEAFSMPGSGNHRCQIAYWHKLLSILENTTFLFLNSVASPSSSAVCDEAAPVCSAVATAGCAWSKYENSASVRSSYVRCTIFCQLSFYESVKEEQVSESLPWGLHEDPLEARLSTWYPSAGQRRERPEGNLVNNFSHVKLPQNDCWTLRFALWNITLLGIDDNQSLKSSCKRIDWCFSKI